MVTKRNKVIHLNSIQRLTKIEVEKILIELMINHTYPLKKNK